MAAQAPCYPHFTGLLVTSILRQPIRCVVGADTSTINTSGFHDAVEQGDLDQIRAWMEKGASPRLCPTTGRFVSHFDVNIPDKGRAGATALHIASRRGHLEIIQVLEQNSGDGLRVEVSCCVLRRSYVRKARSLTLKVRRELIGVHGCEC